MKAIRVISLLACLIFAGFAMGQEQARTTAQDDAFF